MFKIDLRQVVLNNVPWLIRGEPLKSWLLALLQPLVELYDNFLQERKINLRLVEHSFSKASVEHILNNVWPGANGGIWIENLNPIINLDFIFHANENQPVTYYYHASEISQYNYYYHADELILSTNFIVWVPSSLSFDSNLMRWYVDRYKQIGKHYIIKTY